MQLIGSSNAAIGFADGMAVLKAGGSALDAVVATIRRVEANPEDHSVGYSGLPNLLGEVELDASIMDGATLATGAVAAMSNYQDAIETARTVMDTLPHVLIVGRGAEMLAHEAGRPSSNLLTPEAREIWETRIDATDAFTFTVTLSRALMVAMRLAPRTDAGYSAIVPLLWGGQRHLMSAASASVLPWRNGRPGSHHCALCPLNSPIVLVEQVHSADRYR